MVVVERVTRFIILIAIAKGYNADLGLEGLIKAFENVPVHHRKSLTQDPRFRVK